MIAQTDRPVPVPLNDPEPAPSYHLDLTTMGVSALIREEFILRRRCLTGRSRRWMVERLAAVEVALARGGAG